CYLKLGLSRARFQYDEDSLQNLRLPDRRSWNDSPGIHFLQLRPFHTECILVRGRGLCDYLRRLPESSAPEGERDDCALSLHPGESNLHYPLRGCVASVTAAAGFNRTSALRFCNNRRVYGKTRLRDETGI